MVTMVANKMDLAVGVKSNVKTNNEKNTDSNFNKILNQQTNNKIKQDNGGKPGTKVKPTNNNQHKIKNIEKPVEDELESKVDLEELAADIVEQVTEKLNITEEQLNEMLAQLNMTIFDLLLPDKLNTFLMEMYNVEDSLELLMLPDVSDNVKELKTELGTLSEKCNLETEDIKKIIAEMNQESDKKTNNRQETNNTKNTNSQLTETNDTNISKEQVASAEQESTNAKNQTTKITEIEITDNRTEKNDMAKDETKVESNSSKEIPNNVQNITINQNVQKVEVVDQSGEKHILTYNINTEEVIDQIVSSFKVNLTDDVNKMFIQLRPEHLGKLAFSLKTQEGVVTANFMAENLAVKELIEANLANLKMSLQEQGIIVDKLEVVVTDNNMFNENNNPKQFNENNNKKRRAAKMMKINNGLDDDVVEDNENISSSVEKDNNSIDYSV
ncbi:flagellar hook-length control protein FliK [Vallitalea sp.]|jgi:flagellar hook-length control protein FliK|uniref:flagellar hook-length control protein FliK n=1 Tax=Vallitalea sp. TaxID=1882829 RepID=UPI0025E50FBC|nr:flagellar hook-length control protein FliK [Vallitalea sp.]MCT4688227.1 flagellar hook-length control protein FliK [Vallitalea sp.]